MKIINENSRRDLPHINDFGRTTAFLKTLIAGCIVVFLHKHSPF